MPQRTGDRRPEMFIFLHPERSSHPVFRPPSPHPGPFIPVSFLSHAVKLGQ